MKKKPYDYASDYAYPVVEAGPRRFCAVCGMEVSRFGSHLPTCAWMAARKQWLQEREEHARVKDDCDRAMKEIARVLCILAETDDVTQAVAMCMPHLSDLAKQRMDELRQLRSNVKKDMPHEDA